MRPSSRPDTTDLRVPESIRDAVRALMSARRIPGLALAITSTDRLLHSEGFGEAVLQPPQAARPDTAWLWFSLSKLVTATAVMRLAEHGLLDLDAPFRDYLPDVRDVRTAATVRQLLNHTAGIANPLPIRWVRAAEAPECDPHLLARLHRTIARPRHQPGGRAAYTNVGYLILGRVVETVAAEPLREHIRRHVLEPAGMTTTGYRYPPGLPAATGYVRAPRAMDPVLRRVFPAGLAGPRHGDQLSLRPFLVNGAAYGGLLGSVTDAARFVRLHLRDGELDGARVLSVESARQMRQIRWPGKPFDHGLGWFRKPVDDPGRPPFVEHFGAGAGFWNAMRLYPSENLGMVVMANTTQQYDVDALFETIRHAAGG